MTASALHTAPSVSLSTRRVAQAVIAVGAVAVVAGAVLLALNLGTERPEGTDWRIANVGAVAFFVSGAVLALRRPGNALSWIALVAGATQIVGYAAGEWAIYTLLTDPGALPGGAWAQWLSLAVWMPAYLTTGTLLLLLFPDGRPPSPAWRPLVWVTGAVIAVCAVQWALTPWEDLGEPVTDPSTPNPIAAPGVADALGPVPVVAVAVCALLCLASVVVRVRRSTGVERQQLRWAGAGVGAAAVFAVSAYAVGDTLAPLSVGLALCALPAAVAVAVLRHGLWELGPLARRSVLAALLSALVLAVYGLATLLLGDGEVVATAIVAVLLLPLRARLERFVNRLLYGARDEPWVAARALGERLVAPATPEEIAAEVGRTLRLPRVVIAGVDDADVAAALPGERFGDAHDVRVDLQFHGENVGVLVAGGREIGAADRRALADLAPQIAAAVHAARLADDLRASRERIVSAREEERRRLRADLHDEVGPSLAVLALRLDALAATADDGATLRELAGQSRDALAQVRRIVHDLRPAALADLGLAAALDAAVRDVDAGGLHARLTVPSPLGDLPAAVEVAAYRIAREALANAVRHARATRCEVHVERDGDTLVVRIADDGRGIAPDAPRGVGLASMAERADELGGTLDVHTGATGTTIEARLPA